MPVHLRSRKPILCIAWCVCAFAFTSCREAGSVRVQNQVSKTVMQNVYWGDVYLGGSLYPGEETDLVKVKHSEEKLPSSQRVYFTVGGNGRSLTYYTWSTYELEEGAELKIVLTDTTLIVAK